MIGQGLSYYTNLDRLGKGGMGESRREAAMPEEEGLTGKESIIGSD